MLRRAALLAVLAIGLPLRAAEVGPDDPLVRSVRQAIAGALSTALEHASSDHPVAWGDPATDTSGSITVSSPTLQGGRWCRGFSYVARDATTELTDTGLYCRDPAGVWRLAGGRDVLEERALHAAGVASPDASLLRLQKNLVRLAYGGPADGSRDAAFTSALTRFEADEGMRQGLDPDAIRRALAWSTATLARSAAGGVCQPPDGLLGAALVCGRRR